MTKADSSKLALVIGVDVYRSEGLEDLASCRKDAEDVCKILQGLGYTIFQDGPIIGSRLLNKENSWVDIHRAIVNFFKSAKPGQTLLFYFSGHGIPREDEIYLAMPEVNTKEPMVEGFSLTKLTQLMRSTKSMQVVSIIDACYSGAAVLPTTTRSKGMVAKETAGRALAAYDKILENIPKAEGRCFLLSSQAYEPSLASDDSYSLYTKHLIEGLRGAKPGIDEKGLKYPGSFDDEGNVTPETLHKYLYHKVANEAEQVPKIKSDMASNIILAHYPYLAKNKPDVNSIVREGDEHLLKDEYDKAIECYDKAIESDPYLVDAWHKKGNALYNKENYDEAIKCYDRASIINPNHFDSWYKKGLAYKKKNYHDQAIKSYDRAIQIRENSSSVWYEKGLSLSYLKRYEEAIKCYDNAIEYNPKHAEAWYRKGHAFYELSFHEPGKIDEAQTSYNRAKEINPDFTGEWYGNRAPVTGSKTPSPTAATPPPLKKIEEEAKEESIRTTEKEEYQQQRSTTKNSWKWIGIGGAAAGVILISMLATGLLSSIISPSEPTTSTTPPDTQTPDISNNRPPVAIDNPSITTSMNQPVAIRLSARDDDNNNLTATTVSNPLHGTLSEINQDTGVVTYTPNSGFVGTDQFTFKVNDGTVDSSNVGTVRIQVNQQPSSSDPPTVANNPPVPIDQSITTTANTAIDITLAATDHDQNDSLTAEIVSLPSNGALSEINQDTGVVTYTPNSGFVGSDSFTFKVNDGTVDSSNVGTVRIQVS